MYFLNETAHLNLEFTSNLFILTKWKENVENFKIIKELKILMCEPLTFRK